MSRPPATRPSSKRTPASRSAPSKSSAASNVKKAAGVRVSVLAKELGLTSKQLLEGLIKLHVPVKSAASAVDEVVAAKIRHALTKPAHSVRPAAAVKNTAPSHAKPPAAAPPPTHTAPTPPPKPQAAPKPEPEAPVVEAPPPAAPVVAAGPPKSLRLAFPISVNDLAVKMDVKASDLVKHLMSKGIFASLSQMLSQHDATQAAKDFGFELAPHPTLEEQVLEGLSPDPEKLVPRAPVVTFMGHVDHGKTSLLDAIRQSKVAEGEAGGITQHIGAYAVVLEKGRITLLDTPGHEAFTALRARGANVTDVVVLVIAADDGVMPQTAEAIDHAAAAGVPIIVALNKIDKPDANPDRVKQQLTKHGLVAEDWGGKTIIVPVSAKTREGLDTLLDMLLLEAEMLELKADPTSPAQGTVIEARQTKDRGPISTLLVQQGTLRVGDLVVVGVLAGRVRALTNDRGHRVKEARPADPVEVLGLPAVPKAGDRFMVLTDDKVARQIIEQRRERLATQAATPPKRVTLDDLHQRIIAGTLKELKLILKADVQGSLEAIVQSVSKIPTEEVKLTLIHTGVGDISESDVMLAAASDAVVIGFHVGMDPMVQVEAVREGVDVRIFRIIYELVGAITAAIEGLLEPKTEELFLGRAEVKQLFQISKVGIIAGCFVI